MNQLFVGIDVGSQNNAVYLMKPDGEKHSSFRMQNNLGGAKLLTERIVSAIQSQGLEGVVIGMEATSIYGDSLVYALREDGRLGQYPRKIHVLNPKQVSKFKESYSDLPKNDDVDAFVIADKLRFGRITKEVYMDDYRYKALQTLTRARFYAVQDLTREKQRFANYLFLKCSGLAQDKDISNTSATTLALMERFETVDELAYADLDELTAFIDEKGRNFADPAAKAKAIQTAARNSYRLPLTVNNSVNQAMAVSIATMRALEKQIKVLDKAIEQQFAIISNTHAYLYPRHRQGLLCWHHRRNRRHQPFPIPSVRGQVRWPCLDAAPVRGISSPGHQTYQIRQPFPSLLPAGSCQLREKMRLRVPALLCPQVQRGQQTPA